MDPLLCKASHCLSLGFNALQEFTLQILWMFNQWISYYTGESCNIRHTMIIILLWLTSAIKYYIRQWLEFFFIKACILVQIEVKLFAFTFATSRTHLQRLKNKPELKNWHSENRTWKHGRIKDIVFFPTTLTVFLKNESSQYIYLNNMVDLILLLKKMLNLPSGCLSLFSLLLWLW